MGCSSSKDASTSAALTPTSSPPPAKSSTPISTPAANDGSSKQEPPPKPKPKPEAALAKDNGRIVIGANHDTVLRYAALSRKGKDPDDRSKPNQDSYSIHDNLLLQENPTTGGVLLGVYDGHGPDGAPCSQFVQARLSVLVRQTMTRMKTTAVEPLSTDQVHFALQQAHVDCNVELRADESINDKYSGTTAISIYCHEEGDRITVSNVGDSRVVLGTEITPGRLMGVPLSKDQTPHRPEEAKRCQLAGARILSFGQLDPTSKDDDDDSVEDPPRVWSQKGKFPGTAFTRSLGDAIAETLGVSAEPELLTVSLSPKEKVIVLASDGIFDVLSNQQVIDLCFQYQHDPVLACKTVIEESHQAWLIQEGCIDDNDAAASYDDMTAICIFLGDLPTTAPADDAALSANAASQTTAKSEHRRRRRQKTLHNLDEWASDTEG